MNLSGWLRGVVINLAGLRWTSKRTFRHSCPPDLLRVEEGGGSFPLLQLHCMCILGVWLHGKGEMGGTKQRGPACFFTTGFFHE